PLLEVAGKTILDRLLDDLDKIDAINEHIVVTNDTFATYFKAWVARTHNKKQITIINDGAICNEGRKGAVCDILYVIERLSLKDDLLVLAGDNVVDFSFSGFVQFAQEKGTSCITCHYESSVPALQKTGVLKVDEQFKVLEMFEKPVVPPSNWAVPPFYLYKGKDIGLIYKSVASGCGYDAPGNLASWLSKQTDVYAWQLPGKRYDIGDLNSYEEVNQIFKKTNG
ncbi:MAG: sugar phosphate nucleotidyltransferase, partial [Bacteroidota bacterium]|nr:sugar phosphate nucleotidyltransferase [Bacteroidota bacterium]